MKYYEVKAEEFFTRTAHLDMRHIYRRFLSHLPNPARILDAGCGSGRDTLAFKQMGHEVVAIDASPNLAALAAQHTGQQIYICRFQDIQYDSEFDAVWASASLLHVPLAELTEVLARLTRTLKPGGVFYMSFKLGDGEREHEGRRYTDMRPESLSALVSEIEGLVQIDVWTEQDQRPGLVHQWWVEMLARRVTPER